MGKFAEVVIGLFTAADAALNSTVNIEEYSKPEGQGASWVEHQAEVAAEQAAHSLDNDVNETYTSQQV